MHERSYSGQRSPEVQGRRLVHGRQRVQEVSAEEAPAVVLVQRRHHDDALRRRVLGEPQRRELQGKVRGRIEFKIRVRVRVGKVQCCQELVLSIESH